MDVGDLLLMDQDVGFLKHALHGLGVGHEVRRDVALVELHALDHFNGRGGAFGLLNGNDTVFADLFHRFGNQGADLRIVTGDRGYVSDILVIVNGNGQLVNLSHCHFNRFFNALLEDHGIGAGSDVLKTLTHDGLSQNRRRGRTVTGHVVGLAGNLFAQLGTHVLVRI